MTRKMATADVPPDAVPLRLRVPRSNTPSLVTGAVCALRFFFVVIVQESCGRVAPMTDKENSACNALQAMRFTSEGLGLPAAASAPQSDGRSALAGSGACRDWRAGVGANPKPDPDDARARSRSPSAASWGSGSPGGDGSGGSGGGRSSSHVRMRLHALLEDL